jgi:hypothetical protein
MNEMTKELSDNDLQSDEETALRRSGNHVSVQHKYSPPNIRTSCTALRCIAASAGRALPRGRPRR